MQMDVIIANSSGRPADCLNLVLIAVVELTKPFQIDVCAKPHVMISVPCIDKVCFFYYEPCGDCLDFRVCAVGPQWFMTLFSNIF